MGYDDAVSGGLEGRKMVAATVESGDELGRLKRLGMTKLAECLLSVPKAYIDYTQPIRTVSTGRHLGKHGYFILRAVRKQAFDDRGSQTTFWKSVVRVQVDAVDDQGTSVRIAVFGNIWPWKPVEEGAELLVGLRVDPRCSADRALACLRCAGAARHRG